MLNSEGRMKRTGEPSLLRPNRIAAVALNARTFGSYVGPSAILADTFLGRSSTANHGLWANINRNS